MPEKGVAYETYINLTDAANRPQFRTNPTIAIGDFKVSIDGGAFADLTTTPVVTPAGSKAVKISWSAAEMNGDRIHTIGSDVVGEEWDDVSITIDTGKVSLLNPQGFKKNAPGLLIFAMYDSNGDPKTGLTGFTSQESIDGTAPASISGAVAEVGNGLYKISLTAAEWNGDVIGFRFAATGAKDTEFTVRTVQ